MTTVHDYKVKDARGNSLPLSRYKGKVLLIVNVASHCGYTPQYAGLQRLREDFKDLGFEVLAFPCNQFGAQEPGTLPEILKFCRTLYQVDFPIFSKVEVNGPGAEPLFGYLKQACPGWLGLRKIRWNFTKFLVDREGRPIRRYGTRVRPDRIQRDLRNLLK